MYSANSKPISLPTTLLQHTYFNSQNLLGWPKLHINQSTNQSITIHQSNLSLQFASLWLTGHHTIPRKQTAAGFLLQLKNPSRSSTKLGTLLLMPCLSGGSGPTTPVKRRPFPSGDAWGWKLTPAYLHTPATSSPFYWCWGTPESRFVGSKKWLKLGQLGWKK